MTTAQNFRYPLAVRCIHWLGVVAIAAAYLTSESAEDLTESASGLNWHVVAGLGLLLLFVPRLVAWILIRKPQTVSGPEKWAAWTLQLALLLFMAVQPLLGILSVWAGGHSLTVPFSSMQLSPLLQLSGQADFLEEAHEIIGNTFYAVIGIHVLAALWHQFIRRDGLLRRML
jgi:superoxide oxidase